MGNALSKAKPKHAPTLHKQPPLPAARPSPGHGSETKTQGARPNPAQLQLAPSRHRSRPINLSLSDAAILNDGNDPTFLRNLSTLGQVNVPHSGIQLRTVRR